MSTKALPYGIHYEQFEQLVMFSRYDIFIVNRMQTSTSYSYHITRHTKHYFRSGNITCYIEAIVLTRGGCSDIL